MKQPLSEGGNEERVNLVKQKAWVHKESHTPFTSLVSPLKSVVCSTEG